MTTVSSSTTTSTKTLQETLEGELIQRMCVRTRWVAAILPGLGACMGLLSNHESLAQTLTPLLVSGTALCGGLLVRGGSNSVDHVSLILLVLIGSVSRHAIVNEGCSASIVFHVVYGVLPCLSALLFRRARAVVWTTIGVLVCLAIVYSYDLILGQCPSSPMQAHQLHSIVEHRLIPAVAAILANCFVLVTVVDQSRQSVTLHVEAAQKAQQLALLRQNLLHRVTHELRTPLHGIVGSVELLLNSKQLQEEDRELTLLIQRCLSSIVGTCDNVLLATSNGGSAKRAIFSLSRCVDDVADAFAPSAEAKGVELRVDFCGDTECMLRGMENQLLQVLRNLVNNALKFTDHGHVTIRVKTAPCGSNALSCTFEVEDTGPGIDPNECRLLFEAFHQVERDAVSRRHKGAGLGLTIVRELVQLMGGSIVVESHVGKGSRFYFDLILRKASIAEPRSDANCQDGGEIVIVDSQTESLNSCLSVAETMAPSSIRVCTLRTRDELLHQNSDTNVSSQGRRIALLECSGVDADFRILLTTLRTSGWIVFVYGDSTVISEDNDLEKLCSAVFQRPLPLARLGDALYAALVGPDKFSDLSITPDDKPVVETFLKDATHVPKEIEIVPDGAAPTPTMLPKPLPSETKLTPINTTSALNTSQLSSLELPAGSQIVVADDTPLNVKVLTKILSRVVSVPIVSLYSGQAAIDYAAGADKTAGPFFFLMDWHMPTVDGLTAAIDIRRICGDNDISIYVSMVTADIEGLYLEMKKRHISYIGTVSRGVLTKRDDDTSTLAWTTSSEKDVGSSLRGQGSKSSVADTASSDDSFFVDLVAGKPVTIQSVLTILTFFNEQWCTSNGKG